MLVSIICISICKTKQKSTDNLFYISDSSGDNTSLNIIKAVSARECLQYLRDTKLFIPSDVIFVQYLLKRIDCTELYLKCYKYAEGCKALCFYEKPPGNSLLKYLQMLFYK